LHGHDGLILQVQPPKDFFQAFSQLACRDEFEIQRLEVLDASTEAVFDYLIQATRPGGANLGGFSPAVPGMERP
jgi:hypothetical protein